MKDSDVWKDYEFLMSLDPKEIERYCGEWVAVASQEIVAHGKDPERVHEEGCKAGKGIPFMDYIYADPSELPFCYEVPHD